MAQRPESWKSDPLAAANLSRRATRRACGDVTHSAGLSAIPEPLRCRKRHGKMVKKTLHLIGLGIMFRAVWRRKRKKLSVLFGAGGPNHVFGVGGECDLAIAIGFDGLPF